MRGYLGNQGRNRPNNNNKGPRHGNRDGNRGGNNNGNGNGNDASIITGEGEPAIGILGRQGSQGRRDLNALGLLFKPPETSKPAEEKKPAEPKKQQ